MSRKVERLGMVAEAKPDTKEMPKHAPETQVEVPAEVTAPQPVTEVELWQPSTVWQSYSVTVKLPVAFESAAGAAAEVGGQNVQVRRLTPDALYGVQALLHGFHNAAERTGDGRRVDIYPNAIIAALELIGQAARKLDRTAVIQS